MSPVRLHVIIITAISLGVLPGFAAEPAPFLTPLFSDHAVLQRNRELPVWGWSTAGDKVHVTLDQQALDAVARGDGRWQVTFAPLAAGGPYTLTAAGAQTVTAGDLLVGDVWLCSGQSNMEFSVGNARNAEAECAAGDLPQIRQFTGSKTLTRMKPQAQTMRWLGRVLALPPCAAFTAVGYFFRSRVAP